MIPEPRTAINRVERASRARPGVRQASQGLAGWQRVFAIAGLLIALTMLAAFYSTVAASVQRSHSGREQARAEAERQMVCSAFSTAASRDLCMVTVATRNAPRERTPVAYRPWVQSAQGVTRASYN